MTLGEKIKQARMLAGLTQEQFAEKLMISRPAVTKWESDRGLPDIENLKAISKLLNVSIDYLLSEENDINLNVIKEPVDLSDCGKGIKKAKKDRFMRKKYPYAHIMTLICEKVETKQEKIVDNLIGFLTDAPFGIPSFLNSLKLLGNEFYLVEQGQEKYLIMVGDEFMESRRLNPNENYSKRFVIGEYRFTNCGEIQYK